jgi:hypothetical protein
MILQILGLCYPARQKREHFLITLLLFFVDRLCIEQSRKHC